MARSSPCPPMGDINNDGYVTIEDARLVTDYNTGLVALTPEEKQRACVTCVTLERWEIGEPTVIDALKIAQYAAGLIDTFPVCPFIPPPPANLIDSFPVFVPPPRKWGWGILALAALGFMMIRGKLKRRKKK